MNKKQKAASLTKSKYIYILWQATRRNENYKSDYSDLRRTVEAAWNTWTVKRAVEKFQSRWKVEFSCELTKTEIMKRIHSLDPTSDLESNMLPFFFKSMAPLKGYCYLDPDNMMFSWPESIPFKRNGALEIPINAFRDYMVVILDVFDSDEALLEQVKYVKSRYLERVKRSRTGLQFDSKDTFKYLKWFFRYDHVLKYLERLGKIEIDFEKGVIVLPESFGFHEVVPEYLPKNERYKEINNYKKAFEGAVRFIAAAPDISLKAYRDRSGRRREES